MPDLLFLAIHSIYATNTISGIDTFVATHTSIP